MPEETIEAFQDHGTVAPTLERRVRKSVKLFEQLAEAGVDYADVTETLEREGVEKFDASFVELLEGIRASSGSSSRPEPAFMTEVAENPLLAGLTVRRTGEPCALVIFGASGDLTQRKLFPALYTLAVNRLLPREFGVVAVARTPMSDEEFRERMRAAVEEHGRDRSARTSGSGLPRARAMSRPSSPPRAVRTRSSSGCTSSTRSAGRGAIACTTSPCPRRRWRPTVRQIGRQRSASGFTRLIVEKPFGHDAASARELNALLTRDFDESEIFRIDHYLGKETVQNMLVLRFGNGIFEPIWNRNLVDHVQITVASRSVSRAGPASTSKRARSATSSRTTCCSSSR